MANTKKTEPGFAVITSEKVKEIERKTNYGEKLHMNERIWFERKSGIRRAGITFGATNEELDEYFKCNLSVHYFAEHYCQIKREDGTIGKIHLRDYQKKIIDLYNDNRFSILMASRQSGKCNLFNVKVLCKYEDGTEEKISLGVLYFRYLKKERKLTFIENIKYLLYKAYDYFS